MAKKLLTEAEFRKFTKLANLEPLNTYQLKEMYGAPGNRDEEEDPKLPLNKQPVNEMDEEGEEDQLEEELLALFEEDEGEEEMPEEEGEEEMGGEDEEEMPEDDEGEEEMPDVEIDDQGGEGGELKTQIEDALQGLLGLIDQALESAGMGDSMDVQTGEEGDEGMEAPEGGDLSGAPPAPPMGDMEQLAETITRRVTQRLQRESKLDRKAEMIAERVMKRLSSMKAGSTKKAPRRR